MSLKFYFILIALFIVQPSWSLTLDWKGFSRTEAYFEASPEKVYYGNLHLVLKPEVQVIDGLSVFTRLDLYPFSSSEQVSPLGENQTGVVFLNSKKTGEGVQNLPPLFLNISQVYLVYQTEFFKFKLGRAPYHFGLGITYSAETSPFDHWISTYNQMALYFEYASFYFEPSVFLANNNDILSVNQLGMRGDNWNIEALVHYNLESSKAFVEAFGTYKEGPIDTKLSVSYFLKDEDSLKLAVIFEGVSDLPISLSSQFELKTGYVSKDFFVHPNYDVVLLLGNRMTKTPSNELSIAEGRISDVFYVSPRLSFNFLNDTLNLTPIVSVDYTLSDKKLNYEFDLQANYNLKENLFILIQGGFTPSFENNYYGLLVQAAVTF